MSAFIGCLEFTYLRDNIYITAVKLDLQRTNCKGLRKYWNSWFHNKIAKIIIFIRESTKKYIICEKIYLLRIRRKTSAIEPSYECLKTLLTSFINLSNIFVLELRWLVVRLDFSMVLRSHLFKGLDLNFSRLVEIGVVVIFVIFRHMLLQRTEVKVDLLSVLKWTRKSASIVLNIIIIREVLGLKVHLIWWMELN